MSMMKAILATTILAFTPMAASAITLTPDEQDNIGGVVAPNSTKTFTFEPTGPLNVTFSFSASGQATEISKLSFGASYSSTTGTFTPFGTGFTFGGGSLDFAYVDNAFDVYVTAGDLKKPMAFTLSWETTPAPVPLPAAGLLLGAALVGMGGVAAKRRRKAAEEV